MIAPVVVRNFAAVEVATEHETFYLNRKQLEDAIQFLSEIRDGGGRSVVHRMREKYPYISPARMYMYMVAAQACVDHNVMP